jgi:hypothetical protein
MFQFTMDIAIILFLYFKVCEGFDSGQAIVEVIKIHQAKWSLVKNLHNDFDASSEITIVFQVLYKSPKRYQLNHFKVYRIDSKHLCLDQTE